MNFTAPGLQRSNPWFACEVPRPWAAMRLFCLPYAGGSALLYRNWHQALPSLVEVCPVQLPGRMGRLNEPLFTRTAPLADALADRLTPRLDKPYALFGHSMGALLCFELARTLRRRGLPAPVRLFLSAHRAPHLRPAEKPYYHLPDMLFLDHLRRLGGILPEILENQELVNLVLPILRADLELCQTYRFSGDEPPLEQPFTLFSGRSDRLVDTAAVAGWAQHTTSAIRRHVISGDHFFLTGAARELLAVLALELREALDLL